MIVSEADRIDGSDVGLDYHWHTNDGVVNTVSMDGPKVGFNPGTITFIVSSLIV